MLQDSKKNGDEQNRSALQRADKKSNVIAVYLETLAKNIEDRFTLICNSCNYAKTLTASAKFRKKVALEKLGPSDPNLLLNQNDQKDAHIEENTKI